MQKRVMLILFALMLAVVGCNSPSVGPSAPCAVTISQQAADQFIQRIQKSFTRGKTVTITATNDEVSSLVGQYIVELKQKNPNDFIPLDSPIACFQDGKMSVFGDIKLGPSANVAGLITLSAKVDAGKPVFTVEQIQLGPVFVPSELSSEVSRLISRAINQYLDPVTVSEIKLRSGQLSITGQLR